MRVTLLGTGTSHGVPVIGCMCGVCTSDDPRNKRTRTSAFVEVDGRGILVDTATELRLQAIANGVQRVDAALFTHYHADHVGGLDDVKAFNGILGGVLPCYGNAETEEQLRKRFEFAFAGTPYIGLIPHITFTVVEEPFDVCGVHITPIPLQHGRIMATGWRIGDAALLWDTNGIPRASMEMLRGLDLLILDGLRMRPHPTHFCIPEAVEVTRQLRPKLTLLTHLTHEVDHAKVSETLPPGVELGYDGQVVEL